MQTWPAKDPDEVLDYTFDWTDRLVVGEVIDSSTFIVAGPVVELFNTFDPMGVVTIWLSGGLVGEICRVTNHITTSAGREYDGTARLRIREK